MLLVVFIQMFATPACPTITRRVTVFYVINFLKWISVSKIDPYSMVLRLRLQGSPYKTVIIRQGSKVILEYGTLEEARTINQANWVLALWPISWVLLSQSLLWASVFSPVKWTVPTAGLSGCCENVCKRPYAVLHVDSGFLPSLSSKHSKLSSMFL